MKKPVGCDCHHTKRTNRHKNAVGYRFQRTTKPNMHTKNINGAIAIVPYEG